MDKRFAVDEKDAQAFQELQQKLVQFSAQRRQMAFKQGELIRTGKKADLTSTELKTLPQETLTYTRIGKAFFRSPLPELAASLEERQRWCFTEMRRLTEQQKAADQKTKEVEGELRELLQGSPALQHIIASQRGL